MLTEDSFRVTIIVPTVIYPEHLASGNDSLYQLTKSFTPNILKYYIAPANQEISIGDLSDLGDENKLTIEAADWQIEAIEDVANRLKAEVNLSLERTILESEADFKIIMSPNLNDNGLYSNNRFSTGFNESRYLEANPDVAEAVNDGVFLSGFAHYVSFGAAEGRFYGGGFSEANYLATNPDVAAAIAEGKLDSGFSHYVNTGSFEQRMGGFLEQMSDADFTISIGVETGLPLLNTGEEMQRIGPHNENTMTKWKQLFTEELGHLIGLEHPWDPSDGDFVVSGPDADQTKSRMGQDILLTDPDFFEALDIYTLALIWGTPNSPSPISLLGPNSGSIDYGNSTVLAGGSTDALITAHLFGGSGDDIFHPNKGDVRLDGGPGIDTVIFSDPKSAYQASASDGSIASARARRSIEDPIADSMFGVTKRIDTTLVDIEILQFSDGIATLDQLNPFPPEEPDIDFSNPDFFTFPSDSGGSHIIGTPSDDVFNMSIVGTGNDIVDGGAGIDQIVYPGQKFEYTATLDFENFPVIYDAVITDFISGRGLINENAFAVDRFISIELFQFSDGIVTLDQLLQNNSFRFPTDDFA